MLRLVGHYRWEFVKEAFVGPELSPELWSVKTVAVVTLWAGGETWSSCIESLLRFTSDEVPICVWDDAGDSSAAIRELRRLEKKVSREVYYHRQPKNLGVVENLNHAFKAFVNSDVIVLNSDVVVGPNWDRSLCEIASSRTDIATVTSLCSGEGLFGIGEIPQLVNRVPTAREFASISETVRNNSRQIRPVVPTAISFCTLFTRQALNVVGFLDPIFSPGYGEEVDFSLRCRSFGFVHVADDSGLVYHATGESFGETSQNKRKQTNDELVAKRFEFWQPLIDDYLADSDSTLARAKNIARVALGGLRIVVDAEKIHPDFTGTFEGASRLLLALRQHPGVKSVTLVAPAGVVKNLQRWSRTHTNSAIKVVSLRSAQNQEVFDIAFRPFQDYSGATWSQVRRLALRNIVWHLDLIASHVPAYSPDYGSYKSLTINVRHSLDQADAIGVLTKHVGDDLRSTYGGNGLQEKLFLLENGPTVERTRKRLPVHSPELNNLPGKPYILVLGTNYKHKNLTWLLRVFVKVREFGWTGMIVFVGPTPPHGSSLEQDLLLAKLSLPGIVRFMGKVEDGLKKVLLEGAKLAVVPSVTEGWGLVPIEAAVAGVPPLTTVGGGLRDVKPQEALSLDLASDDDSAQVAYSLLTDRTVAKRQLGAWQIKASQLDWTTGAEALVQAASATLSRAGWQYSQSSPAGFAIGARIHRVKMMVARRLNDMVFGISTFFFPLDSRARNFLKARLKSIRSRRY